MGEAYVTKDQVLEREVGITLYLEKDYFTFIVMSLKSDCLLFGISNDSKGEGDKCRFEGYLVLF